MKTFYPYKSKSFKAGLDILYRQFNDIDVYVEDTDKEYFYYNILKELLPDIKLEKIFPLNGKGDVIKQSTIYQTDSKKFFLVDLDFDDLLGKQITIPNLVYLQRYSIENYLLSKRAIYETIRIYNPLYKNSIIDSKIDIDDCLNTIYHYLWEFAMAGLIIKYYSLGIKFKNPDIKSFYFYIENNYSYSKTDIEYFREVEGLLKQVDGRYTYSARSKFLSKLLIGKKPIDFIPGKMIVTLFNIELRRKRLLFQISDDSFKYALSKDIDINPLSFIRDTINSLS